VKNLKLTALIICIIITAAITTGVFNSRFAHLTIDAWAFGASLFLIFEALYKMLTLKENLWPNQFMRFIRMVIGVCIFTIHTCQVIYGM